MTDVSWEEIGARDLVVQRATPIGTLDVRAFDFTPVPYDRAKFEALPAPEYDTLSIDSPYDSERVMLPLDQLEILIDALTELRDALTANGAKGAIPS